MSDIVERLRDRDAVVMAGLFHAIPAMREAANEIEALRSQVEGAATAEQKRCADIASQNYGLMFTKPEHQKVAQTVARQIFRAIRDGSTLPSTERQDG